MDTHLLYGSEVVSRRVGGGPVSNHHGQSVCGLESLTYHDNLARYVDEARAAGAEPILVTSVARRIFEKGKIRGELAPWAAAMKKVAAEKKVPLVDLSGRSIEMLERIGPKAAAEFDPITKTGQHDGTHLNPKGGEAMTALIIDELRHTEPRLAKLLKP